MWVIVFDAWQTWGTWSSCIFSNIPNWRDLQYPNLSNTAMFSESFSPIQVALSVWSARTSPVFGWTKTLRDP